MNSPRVTVRLFVMEVANGDAWKPWRVFEACSVHDVIDELPDYPAGYDYRIKRLDRVLLNTTVNLIREIWNYTDFENQT